MQRQQIQIAYEPYGHTCWANVYLPTDYNPSKKYPLLISLHGQGELSPNGTQANLSLLEAADGSVPNVIANGKFISQVTKEEFEWIVFAPQAPTAQGWSFAEAQVAYLLAQFLPLYPINTAQVGVTGYSSGGNGTWTCLTDNTDGSKLYDKLAWIIPVSAASITTAEIAALVANQAASKLPIWAICGTADSFCTNNQLAITTLLQGKASPAPIWSAIPNGGHWSTQAYETNWYGAGNGAGAPGDVPPVVSINEPGGISPLDWAFKQVQGTVVTTPPVTTPPTPSSTVTITVTGLTPPAGTTITVIFAGPSGTVESTITGTIS